MQSSAATVTDYLRQVPASRGDVLTRLRGLCVKTLTGYEECMEYGVPCYRKNGKIEVGFASQKKYIAIYVLKKGVVDAFRAELTGASIGKGCIRFSKPDKLEFGVIRKLLEATRNSEEAPCL